MNLAQVTEELSQVMELLSQKIIELRELEYKYDIRYYDLLLHSHGANAPAREAEAVSTLEMEGLYEPVTVARGDVKALFVRKDCLIEISKNLRSLEMTENPRGT